MFLIALTGGCEPEQEPLECEEALWRDTCVAAMAEARAWGALASDACDPYYSKEAFWPDEDQQTSACASGWDSPTCAAFLSGSECFNATAPLFYAPGPECDTAAR